MYFRFINDYFTITPAIWFSLKMPESTMKLAYQVGISCDYRDTIDIKGKGPMKLYLVSPRNLSRVNSFLANEDVPTDIYCL